MPPSVSEDAQHEWLLLYGKAFDDKLVAARVMYSSCKRDVEKMLEVYRREEKELHPGDISAMGAPMIYASIYFESFLYFIVGALDILASINYHFIYRGDNRTLTESYFKKQMENFLNAPNINRDYSKLILTNKKWIEDVQNNRDGLAHKASVFLTIEKDRIMVTKRRPYDDKVMLNKLPREDLLQYLDNTFVNLYRFLDDYIMVHRKRIPVSEAARVRLDSLEKDQIKAVRSS
ncbi:MAG: hypothetical protein ABSF09_00665 [Candidatus Bathyarchaeia archaeon]|jgi:hypothetical protein